MEAMDGGTDHDAGSNGQPAQRLIESTTPHRSLTRSPWLQRREALIGPPIRRPGGQVRFLGVAYQDTP